MMGLKSWVGFSLCIGVFILIGIIPRSEAQSSSSEKIILLQLQQYLEYPNVLESWQKWTDFCYLPPTSAVTVICSNGHVTELTVVGNKTSSSKQPIASGKFTVTQQTLSQKFNIDALFTVITKLSSLKKLSLVSLGIWGTLPSKIGRFHSLEVLNISSNYIYGEIPQEISSLKSLKSLNLAENLISGNVPDLSSLQSLQEIDLSNNEIGPTFPSLGTSLVSIILRNNSIRSQIPPRMKNNEDLQRLDVSTNHLVGPLPSFVLSLPSLWYVNLADNQLSGMLPKSTVCGKRLWFVDISRNLFIGKLPSCIGANSSKYRKVLSDWNCLSGSKFQHPTSSCQRQALAVIPPAKKTSAKKQKQEDGIRIGLIFGLLGGSILLIGTVGSLIWVICKKRSSVEALNKYDKSTAGKMATRPSPIVDTKFVARSMRMPAIGLPPYHSYSIEELEEATNKFDQVNLITEGSQEQVYRGLLPNGAAVLIKCLKVKEKHSSKSLKQHMEVLSLLRHQNLVSVLGHCVVINTDRHKSSTIYVVFEHVSNGSLREHLTDWRRKDRLKWPQRITISIGIAKGVQFLHTGVAPGVFGNDLKIQDVLLDESLTPKISNYRIPVPFKAEDGSSKEKAEKDDIYKLGVIMLELLIGRQVTSESQVEEVKLELERSLSESASALQHAVNLSMRGTFAYPSLKTAVEIILNCLNKDPSRRPPMEDVVWHLQYSIQAQQAWTTSGNLALNSGNLGVQN